MNSEIGHKGNGVDTTFQPDAVVDIPLSAESTLRMETYQTVYGFNAAVGHWGRRYLKEETDAIVNERYGEGNVSPKTGFTELWKTPEGTPRERSIEDELVVANAVANAAMRLQGLGPDDIDFIFLGSGAAIVDHPDVTRYSWTLAQELGLGRLVPDDVRDKSARLYDRYLACYSGASAIRAALLDPELQGKIGLFVNMEGITSLLPEMTPEYTDPISVQFFSNGASSFIMKPGVSMKLVPDEKGKPIQEERVVPDLKGALAARVPYRHLMNQRSIDRGKIHQTIGNTEMIVLPTPPDGMMINMDGGATGELFVGKKVDRMPARVTRAYGRWLTSYPERIMNPKNQRLLKFNAHPAGADVNNGMNERTPEGVHFKWGLKPDGNTSASANTIALIRDARNYKPGDHVLMATMGGGSIQGVMILEVGETRFTNNF